MNSNRKQGSSFHAMSKSIEGENNRFEYTSVSNQTTHLSDTSSIQQHRFNLQDSQRHVNQNLQFHSTQLSSQGKGISKVLFPFDSIASNNVPKIKESDPEKLEQYRVENNHGNLEKIISEKKKKIKSKSEIPQQFLTEKEREPNRLTFEELFKNKANNGVPTKQNNHSNKLHTFNPDKSSQFQSDSSYQDSIQIEERITPSKKKEKSNKNNINQFNQISSHTSSTSATNHLQQEKQLIDNKSMNDSQQNSYSSTKSLPKSSHVRSVSHINPSTSYHHNESEKNNNLQKDQVISTQISTSNVNNHNISKSPPKNNNKNYNLEQLDYIIKRNLERIQSQKAKQQQELQSDSNTYQLNKASGKNDKSQNNQLTINLIVKGKQQSDKEAIQAKQQVNSNPITDKVVQLKETINKDPSIKKDALQIPTSQQNNQNKIKRSLDSVDNSLNSKKEIQSRNSQIKQKEAIDHEDQSIQTSIDVALGKYFNKDDLKLLSEVKRIKREEDISRILQKEREMQERLQQNLINLENEIKQARMQSNKQTDQSQSMVAKNNSLNQKKVIPNKNTQPVPKTPNSDLTEEQEEEKFLQNNYFSSRQFSSIQTSTHSKTLPLQFNSKSQQITRNQAQSFDGDHEFNQIFHISKQSLNASQSGGTNSHSSSFQDEARKLDRKEQPGRKLQLQKKKSASVHISSSETKPAGKTQKKKNSIPNFIPPQISIPLSAHQTLKVPSKDLLKEIYKSMCAEGLISPNQQKSNRKTSMKAQQSHQLSDLQQQVQKQESLTRDDTSQQNPKSKSNNSTPKYKKSQNNELQNRHHQSNRSLQMKNTNKDLRMNNSPNLSITNKAEQSQLSQRQSHHHLNSPQSSDGISVVSKGEHISDEILDDFYLNKTHSTTQKQSPCVEIEKQQIPLDPHQQLAPFSKNIYLRDSQPPVLNPELQLISNLSSFNKRINIPPKFDSSQFESTNSLVQNSISGALESQNVRDYKSFGFNEEIKLEMLEEIQTLDENAMDQLDVENQFVPENDQQQQQLYDLTSTQLSELHSMLENANQLDPEIIQLQQDLYLFYSSATTIQRIYRGYLTRKYITTALQEIKVQEEERMFFEAEKHLEDSQIHPEELLLENNTNPPPLDHVDDQFIKQSSPVKSPSNLVVVVNTSRQQKQKENKSQEINDFNQLIFKQDANVQRSNTEEIDRLKFEQAEKWDQVLGQLAILQANNNETINEDAKRIISQIQQISEQNKNNLIETCVKQSISSSLTPNKLTQAVTQDSQKINKQKTRIKPNLKLMSQETDPMNESSVEFKELEGKIPNKRNDKSNSQNLIKNFFQEFASRIYSENPIPQDTVEELLRTREEAIETKKQNKMAAINQMHEKNRISPKSFERKQIELEKWVNKKKENLKHERSDIEKGWQQFALTFKKTKRDLKFLEQNRRIDSSGKLLQLNEEEQIRRLLSLRSESDFSFEDSSDFRRSLEFSTLRNSDDGLKIKVVDNFKPSISQKPHRNISNNANNTMNKSDSIQIQNISSVINNHQSTPEINPEKEKEDPKLLVDSQNIPNNLINQSQSSNHNSSNLLIISDKIENHSAHENSQTKPVESPNELVQSNTFSEESKIEQQIQNPLLEHLSDDEEFKLDVSPIFVSLLIEDSVISCENAPQPSNSSLAIQQTQKCVNEPNQVINEHEQNKIIIESAQDPSQVFALSPKQLVSIYRKEGIQMKQGGQHLRLPAAISNQVDHLNNNQKDACVNPLEEQSAFDEYQKMTSIGEDEVQISPQKVPTEVSDKLEGLECASLNFIKDYLVSLSEFIKDNFEDDLLERVNAPLGMEAIDFLKTFTITESLESSEGEISSAPIYPIVKYIHMQRPVISEELFSHFNDIFNRERNNPVMSEGMIMLENFHMRMVYDSFNESLDSMRPFGLRGKPLPWKLNQNKLSFITITNENIEKILGLAIAKLLKWGSFLCGFIPERIESPMGGIIEIDDDYLTQIKEDRLAQMLENDVIENEDKWLNYDDEETDVQLELSDEVFNFLIEETAALCYQLTYGSCSSSEEGVSPVQAIENLLLNQRKQTMHENIFGNPLNQKRQKHNPSTGGIRPTDDLGIPELLAKQKKQYAQEKFIKNLKQIPPILKQNPLFADASLSKDSLNSSF